MNDLSKFSLLFIKITIFVKKLLFFVLVMKIVLYFSELFAVFFLYSKIFFEKTKCCKLNENH